MKNKYTVISEVKKSDAIAAAIRIHRKTMTPLFAALGMCKTLKHTFSNKRAAIRFAKNKGTNIESVKVYSNGVLIQHFPSPDGSHRQEPASRAGLDAAKPQP